MHVLIVSMHTSPYVALGAGDGGGMNVVVAQQARALAARGHRVTIATRRFDDAPDVVEIDPSITLRHLPAGPPTLLPKSRIDDHLDEFAGRLAALARPDVVHSHHWMSGVAALPASRTWGVGHVMSFHSIAAPVGAPLDAGEPPESPHRIPGEQTCARESDLLAVISRAEGETLVERYAAPRDRLVVVPPGVDRSLFWAADRLAGTRSEDYLLFAARLQPLKGVDLVIDALARLPQGQRPRLVIAGEVSEDFADYHRDISDQVARAGLGDHVQYAGALPREEFADLMRGARALVVPSRSETFGLVALEAAACGVPTLASATGGLTEAVADDRSGRLLPRDPAVWARAIEDVMGDDALHARWSAGALEHAAQFTWERAAALLEAAYERLA